MAFSNKQGHLLLSTGNKSEVAVGYSTIYGDMAGAYNPLKDVYKTKVYELSKWRNNSSETRHFSVKKPIPNSIILKEPSAELAFDQKDTDSLPSYNELDMILEHLIENDLGVNEIIKRLLENSCKSERSSVPQRVQEISSLVGSKDFQKTIFVR